MRRGRRQGRRGMGSEERGDSGLRGLGSLCAWIVGMLLDGGCTGP